MPSEASQYEEKFGSHRFLRMLYEGKFSDLELVCRDQVWQVHRALLATGSKYFDRALAGPWKEVQTSRFNLPDDEPKYINAMLEYLYAGNYISVDTRLSFHIGVGIVMDKYMVSISPDKDVVKRKLLTRLAHVKLSLYTNPNTATAKDAENIAEIACALTLCYNNFPDTTYHKEAFINTLAPYFGRLTRDPAFNAAIMFDPAIAVDMLRAAGDYYGIHGPPKSFPRPEEQPKPLLRSMSLPDLREQ